MTAMVGLLSAVAAELPPVGADTLRVANGYWRQSTGHPDDLLEAKIACWTYLDAKHGSSTAIVDREDRLLRALLCVLEPEGDEEAMSASAEWFMEMTNQARGQGLTAFDEALDDFAERIDRLPRPLISALFLACADGLLPEFRRWAAHTRHDNEPLAQRALAAARTFALTGNTHPDAENLLASLEQATPEGESPDEFSSTAAQDCWICVDIGIRVMVDEDYQAGSGIEYALEPVMQSTTERLYGVSQLGSGPDEDAQTEAILNEQDARAALGFCDWAIGLLTERSTLTQADLAELTSRATVLAP
jgi:hypothetical protein